jgi:hypothetical protein
MAGYQKSKVLLEESECKTRIKTLRRMKLTEVATTAYGFRALCVVCMVAHRFLAADGCCSTSRSRNSTSRFECWIASCARSTVTPVQAHHSAQTKHDEFVVRELTLIPDKVR